jgi:hypothetical protein
VYIELNKLDRFIAGTALRGSQFVNKSQECWQRAASEYEMIRLHCDRGEGHGMFKGKLLPRYYPVCNRTVGRV